MNSHDVFISYSSKNKEIADAIVSKMEAGGIKCWYAPRDIPVGENWAKAIMDAIGRSRFFVLVYSDESNRSKQVANELTAAFNSDCTIIPFRISESEMDAGMSYYLSNVHWLDAITPPMEENIEKLISRIRGEAPDDKNQEKNQNLPRGKKVHSLAPKVELLKKAWGFLKKPLFVVCALLVLFKGTDYYRYKKNIDVDQWIRLVRHFEQNNYTGGNCLSNDGEYMAVYKEDGRLDIVQMDDGLVLFEFETGMPEQSNPVTLIGDMQRYCGFACHDGFQLFDLITGERITSFPLLINDSDYVAAMGMSVDDNVLIINLCERGAEFSHLLQCYSIDTGELFYSCEESLTWLATTDDMRYIIFYKTNGELTCYSVAEGQMCAMTHEEVAKLCYHNMFHYTSIHGDIEHFDSKSEIFIATLQVGENYRIIITDLATGKEIYSRTCYSLFALDYQEGRLIVWSNGAVQEIDIATNRSKELYQYEDLKVSRGNTDKEIELNGLMFVDNTKYMVVVVETDGVSRTEVIDYRTKAGLLPAIQCREI